MGGPLGLAVTAGAVAASFIDWGGSAQKATIGLDDMQRSVVDLRAEFQGLKRDQQEAALVAWQEKQIAAADAVTARFDVLRQSLRDALVAPGDARSGGYAQQLQQYQELIDRLNEAKASGADLSPILREVADRFNVPAAALDSWISQAGAISKASDESQEAAKRLGVLTDAMRENTAAVRENNLANVETDEAGNKYLAQLQRQADFAGKLTEVQRVNIAIEKGYAGVLSETDKALALKNAALIDQANATKSVTKATNDSANAYQALYDRLYPAEAAQREYNKQVDLLKKYLSGDQLADAIDRLNFAMEGADATGPADAIAEYRKELEALEDKINPAGKAAKDFAAEQKRLREEIERTGDPTGKWTALLQENERQFEQNTRATSEWAKWTEGALDRVDGAFADAWRNIGDGFSSFRDSLTNAFKQMLAELAHMAITKPIIMQIGAALGIGGGSAGAGLMSLGGGAGGSGGSLLADAWNYGSSLYSTVTSGFGQAVMAGWNSGTGLLGGLQGAAAGGWNYGSTALGGMFSGGSTAAGTAAGYGLGQPLVTGTAGSASYAASSGIWGSGVSGTAAGLYGIGGALYGYGQSGWKGAATGALGGVGGGIAGGLAGVAAAEALGMAAGSILGPIGAALGAALGGWIGGSLFGGDWQTKDVGLAFGVEGGDFTGQQYEYQKKKGGLFGSNKKRTRYSALDPEFESSLRDTYDATQAGVAELFESLSYSIDEGTLDGLQLAKTQISTKGKTEEEIQKAIADWFGTAAEAMNSELNKVFATGLDLDLAGMQAFVGNLLSVNEVLRYLDVGMYDASVAGGRLAEALSAAAGGLDALAANSQTYYSAFFTEAEKVEDTVDSIKRAFESADVELAASREAYRAMVEDIDITTSPGREMFATLMGLAGQAATYYSIVEQQAAQAQAAAQERAAQLVANLNGYYEQFATDAEKTEDALSGVRAQFAALSVALPESRELFRDVVSGLDTTTEAGQKMFETLIGLAGSADAYYDILESRAQTVSSAAVAATRGALSSLSAALSAQKALVSEQYQSQSDAIREAMDRASDSVSDMRSVANTLRSTVNGLRLESEQYAAQSRRTAQQTIGSALSGSGRVQMTAQLEQALDTVSQSSEDLFGSFESYARDYWQTYFAIESLADRADDQLTTEERTLKALESQLDNVQRFHDAEIERLDGVLEGANAQLEALLGIDTSVQSVETALAAFTAALSAAQQLQNANSSVTSVTGLGGVKRQVTSEGYILDELGNQMELFGEAMRVVGNKVVGGAGSSLNIGADGQLSWGAGDYEKWAKQVGIPGFASGGLHAGGLRLVGENGPELEVTGPSRIYNASQTAAMLGGGGDSGSVAELRQLRAEIHNDLRQMAKFMEQTATSTRQMNQSGVQIVGTVQTKGVAA